MKEFISHINVEVFFLNNHDKMSTNTNTNTHTHTNMQVNANLTPTCRGIPTNDRTMGGGRIKLLKRLLCHIFDHKAELPKPNEMVEFNTIQMKNSPYIRVQCKRCNQIKTIV
jgi:hypothetical protein